MSKTAELAAKLRGLDIQEMYENDFFLTWDKTDDEIAAVFAVADALRDLRERNISTKIFDSGLGISNFRDNSTRTRFSFASDAAQYAQGDQRQLRLIQGDARQAAGAGGCRNSASDGKSFGMRMRKARHDLRRRQPRHCSPGVGHRSAGA